MADLLIVSTAGSSEWAVSAIGIEGVRERIHLSILSWSRVSWSSVVQNARGFWQEADAMIVHHTAAFICIIIPKIHLVEDNPPVDMISLLNITTSLRRALASIDLRRSHPRRVTSQQTG